MNVYKVILKLGQMKIDNFKGRTSIWRRMKMRRIGLWK